MSRAMAADGDGDGDCERKKYKGVRRRRWGKWVSEIRVPGTRHRLWLGSYATAEAAAVAHDAAVFFLRGPDAAEGFNFPESAEGCYWRRATSAGGQLSPQSVQRVASDAGMAADAGLAVGRAEERELQQQQQHQHQQEQNQQQQLVQQPAVLTGEYWGPAGGDEWWSDYGVGGF
ncbi:ethylene-responsive transcription factor ERF020-like [Ananas comosus]|uniref:Ethylene-responsive transcription factor ERF020-like n=1 Tax=Ananas comosus TaxID=4615 RepID=A0A6P5GAY6_ANACO|nr:ethylene-responsive transcription factor ERF020-like [Ananas comosus]